MKNIKRKRKKKKSKVSNQFYKIGLIAFIKETFDMLFDYFI